MERPVPDKPKSKKRQLRKPETVRERANKPSGAKPRRIKAAGSAATKPFRVIGRFLAVLFRPFAFLLKPFKMRPVRFIGRVLAAIFLLGYFRNSWKELRQVEWPDRKTTWKLTLAVFMFALFFSLIISVSDYGLDKLFKKVILK